MHQPATLPKLDITAELDLKVGTRDIIEMIAEERRAQLETHAATLERERAQADKRVQKCLEDMQKRALKLGKQRLRHLAKLITEDELQAGRKQIDDVTKEYTDRVDLIIKNKSDEIMLE